MSPTIKAGLKSVFTKPFQRAAKALAACCTAPREIIRMAAQGNIRFDGVLDQIFETDDFDLMLSNAFGSVCGGAFGAFVAGAIGWFATGGGVAGIVAAGMGCAVGFTAGALAGPCAIGLVAAAVMFTINASPPGWFVNYQTGVREEKDRQAVIAAQKAAAAQAAAQQQAAQQAAATAAAKAAAVAPQKVKEAVENLIGNINKLPEDDREAFAFDAIRKLKDSFQKAVAPDDLTTDSSVADNAPKIRLKRQS